MWISVYSQGIVYIQMLLWGCCWKREYSLAEKEMESAFHLQAKEILSCAAEHAASVHTPPVHTTAHLKDRFSHIYCATYFSFLCHPNLRFNVSRQNQIMHFFGTGAWVTSLELAQVHADTNEIEDKLGLSSQIVLFNRKRNLLDSWRKRKRRKIFVPQLFNFYFW